MSALHPEAAVQLVLGRRAANDPKRSPVASGKPGPRVFGEALEDVPKNSKIAGLQCVGELK